MIAIPGYRVLRRLGRGRAFDVLEVWSDERDCRCVAKLPRPERRRDRATRARLRAEARMLLSLSHPHVVRAYALLHPQRVPVLILETLAGATLESLIAHHPRGLAPVDVAILGRQLCAALHYLHGRGIVHSDLKPANVIAQAGVAKLFDLSLARAPGPTAPGIGTRGYLAPEQVRGGVLSPASDVWALATVLREAAGRRRLPRAVEACLRACLADDASARPALVEVAGAMDALRGSR